MNTRPAAVQDLFYPANPKILASQVADFIDIDEIEDFEPKALIVPHAGYIYSGSTAGKAYAQVQSLAKSIHRIVLLGPCHRVWIKGIAIPDVQYFEIPLGKVEIDLGRLKKLSRFAQISTSNLAHEQEHSIEVQLPFIQLIFPHVQLLPMVVGDVTVEEVAEVIDFLWDEKTLIIVSSDLSHFHNYTTAREWDSKTNYAIENFQIDDITQEMACGSSAIKGLLKVAQEKNFKVKNIALCNSGDTAGTKDRVVGYGSYVIY